MAQKLKSPFPWVGGKFYSADRIIDAFPQPEQYKTFIDVFGGAAHILLRKPPYSHLEVYNDFNNDLVNFWMQCRNNPDELQRQIDSLPYARSLYVDWQESLFDGSQLDEMERAVRWFYVLRSSFAGCMQRSGMHWGYSIGDSGSSSVSKLRSASCLFSAISERFHSVQIESYDFERIIKIYGRTSTFFYCDPPYIGAEQYYQGVPVFTLQNHKRLAALLNETSAQVALSYSPHEILEDLYPVPKWRRITWTTYKHSEKTSSERQAATEMLLMNYPESARSLWNEV